MQNKENSTNDSMNWNSIYQEISEIIGEKNTLKLYNHYRGMYINFPMKLFSKEGLENVVRESNRSELHAIAREYNYSIRHLDRVRKEIKKNN